MKKTISLALILISVFSVLSISAYADEPTETVVVSVDETDFIFSAATSEDFRSKFIADYMNPADNDVATYGLTCTLFGHDIESTYVTTVTHKASSSDPRCKQERYLCETCTRCDYTNSTLVSTTYISCC